MIVKATAVLFVLCVSLDVGTPGMFDEPPTPLLSPEPFESPVLAFPLELLAGLKTDVGRLSAICVGVMVACGVVGTMMD